MAVRRAKWYKVTQGAKHGLRASTTIEGIRVIESVAWTGWVIPGRYFDDLSDSQLGLIVNMPPNGRGAAVPYDPETDEYLVLYTIFPAMLPSSRTIEIAQDYGKRFVRVRPNAFNGLLALCDVPGVCEAGQVAEIGEVIPMKWFSGLDQQQFAKLVELDLVEPYTPDPMERDVLYEQYPGANPDYVAEKDESEG